MRCVRANAWGRIRLAGPVLAMAAVQAAAQSHSHTPSPVQTQPAKEAGREGWSIKTEQQAITKAREIVGLPDDAAPKFSAEVTTLGEDNTPFLHHRIVGRPIWHVVIADWKLDLKSAAPAEHDQFARVFDVFVDPTDGKLLKAASRWPENVPPVAPQPSARSAEEQKPRSDEERYHGFPDPPPRIDLLRALEIMHRDAVVSPYRAKQIVAHYVMQSLHGGKPQAVWAITLWGIPPRPSSFPGVPVDSRNHIRTVLNAETGRCLFSSTTPQPEGPAPRTHPEDQE